MIATRCLVLGIVLASSPSLARADSSVEVSSDGWTVSVNPSARLVSILHKRLGMVFDRARLNLLGNDGLTKLDAWTVEKKDQRELSIKTAKPASSWLIGLDQNSIRISSTSYSAVITAHAPAGKGRMAARIQDPRGVPVNWVGTNEIVGSFGGKETVRRSYLPSQNPEVMYFALGLVSGSNLQSLFDRKTDTVISLPEGTHLRPANNEDHEYDVTIPVQGNAVIDILPDYYTRTLGVPFYIPMDDTQFPTAPAVWGSWTSYYAEVTEDDIVRNADWIAANLKPYGFRYVQLDDGYDRGKSGEHYWIENWDKTKFPHGPEWLTNYIRSKGLLAGLWIVPNSYAGATAQHPDWYLRHKDGKFILDYNTPALDASNPQVLEFLTTEFARLRGWGFDYYKFDGEHALTKYVPSVDRSKLYDKEKDPIAVYRDRLKVIREAIGPRAFIEGCPAGAPLDGIGYMNSFFTGHDVYNSWQGMYALFSSINANAFLNRMVAYVMPGEGIEVGPPLTVEEARKKRPPSVVNVARTREEPLMGFGTTAAEARTLVTYLALTGVAYPVASVLPELPPERVRLLQMTLPTMPIFPADLFSRGTDMQWNKFKRTTPDTYIHNYPEVLDLKVNSISGVYDVVGLTNWRSGNAVKELQFSKHLGLEPSAKYVVFDFWNQRVLGVFEERIQVEVGSHDTRVLLIHPVSDHPQLVGISRHITGAYSIASLWWDSGRRTMGGGSQTIQGDTYELWFSLPEGMILNQARATASDSRDLPVKVEPTGTFLRISFAGAGIVNWELQFSTR